MYLQINTIKSLPAFKENAKKEEGGKGNMRFALICQFFSCAQQAAAVCRAYVALQTNTILLDKRGVAELLIKC